MIVEQEQSNVSIPSDVVQIKTGINQENIDFITMLLSSNLYSHPEESFLREIVSNAWDSHVAANTTDKPVIINITNNTISIRDYGTGLSKEMFSELYCNIGSSTKRSSDAFIGGFGIGRYSALACSDTVYVDSYYNGIVQHYVIIKENGKITTNLLSENTTDEYNGLCVMLQNINPLVFINLLYILSFFPNIYVNSTVAQSAVQKFNNRKIKYGTYLAQVDSPIRNSILLGNVLYPLDETQIKFVTLPNDEQLFIKSLEDSGYAIRFNIGELKVAPNRENLIYNQDSKVKISQKLDDAFSELCQNCLKIQKNFNNVSEYLEYVNCDDIYYDFINSIICKTGNDNITGMLYIGYLYNNIQISLNNTIYDKTEAVFVKRFILNNNWNSLIKAVHRQRCAKWKLSRFYISLCRYKKIIIRNSNLTNNVKKFLNEKYSNKDIVIFEDITYSDIKKLFERYLSAQSSNSLELYANSELFRLYTDYFINDCEIIDIKTNPDYAQFVKNNRQSSVKSAITSFILHDVCYGTKTSFTSIQECCAYLKSLHRGVILIPYTEDVYTDDYSIFEHIFKVFKVSKSVFEVLNNMQLTCVVNPQKELHTNKILRICKTVQIIQREYGTILDTSRYSDWLSDDIYQQYCKIIKTYREHNFAKVDLFDNIDIPIDDWTFYILSKVCTVIDKIIPLSTHINEYEDSLMLIWLCIKQKILRPNLKALRRLNLNPLISQLRQVCIK